MADIVKCRVCHRDISKSKEKENEDWIKIGQRSYYHVRCYEDWKRGSSNLEAEMEDGLWMNSAFDFMTKEMKISINYCKFQQQFTSFLKKSFTAKGIYFSLRYHYEIKKGDKTKAQGGIGIVPYVYNDACQYYSQQRYRSEEICKQIERQLKLKEQREVVEVRLKKEKTKEPLYSKEELDSLYSMEDDEDGAC